MASCVWRGDEGSGHSLAIVGDGLCAALARRGVAVEHMPVAAAPAGSPAPGVASHWPPRFEAPSDGPFVLYQPWEFGEAPALWAERIRELVDEVWTPSAYAREAYLRAGVAPQLVHVVPNGVDLERFRPEGPARPLPVRRGTVLLFVGGTTHRKGIDLLLAAYGRAFDADDDVVLVVKGFGSDTYYRGQTAEPLLAELAARPGAPALVSLDGTLRYDELPALYRAADCVVQPYRGEGFCLPALEALACGKPLVVTAGGPTDEFASDACAWRVPSRRVGFEPGRLPEDLRPAGEGFLLEPDLDALAECLREAADPSLRARRAAAAREHAERFGWDAAAGAAARRLEALSGTTPIRTVPAAVVPGARGTVFAAAADWREPATWVPALEAYAAAFGPADDTTLVLPAEDGAAASAAVAAHLERAALDLDALPDVVVADAAALSPEALELVADAFICGAGERPARARRLCPPERDALRSLVHS